MSLVRNCTGTRLSPAFPRSIVNLIRIGHLAGGVRKRLDPEIKPHWKFYSRYAEFLDDQFQQSRSVKSSMSVHELAHQAGIMSTSQLFAAVLLFSSPGCPHEEPSCITATEYIEVNLSLIASPQPLTASRAPGMRTEHAAEPRELEVVP